MVDKELLRNSSLFVAYMGMSGMGEVLISMVGEVLFIMDFHGGLLVLA